MSEEADLDWVRTVLRRLGANPDEGEGIPLEAGERTIAAEGPSGLATSIEASDPEARKGILAAFPDAEMDYFE